jgi:hypothetical protein
MFLICALPITAVVAGAEHFTMLKVIADTAQCRVSFSAFSLIHTTSLSRYPKEVSGPPPLTSCRCPELPHFAMYNDS